MESLAEIVKSFTSALYLNNLSLVWHSMWGVVWLLYARMQDYCPKAFIDVEGNLSSKDCNFSRSVSSLDFATFSERYGVENRAMYDFSHSLVQSSESEDFFSLYVSLRIPTLYIYGFESVFSHIGTLESQGCGIACISGSGHHPFLSNPDDFYGILYSFIVKYL